MCWWCSLLVLSFFFFVGCLVSERGAQRACVDVSQHSNSSPLDSADEDAVATAVGVQLRGGRQDDDVTEWPPTNTKLSVSQPSNNNRDTATTTFVPD
jgi:hypothetical protein